MLWNLALFIYLLLITPKLLFSGKKHPGLLQRLGFSLPNIQDVIWIHAVSVGEVKAAIPLFRKIKREHPAARILLTTTTATGQEEAKRSLPDASAICYAPIDFSFVVRRFARHFRPKQLLLIEGDIWPNLVKSVPTILVSGKLSVKSAARLALVPFLAKKLFAPLKLICLQNEEYAERLRPFLLDPFKIRITGNLKFDLDPQPFAPLNLPSQNPFITISCTHAPEEELLLDLLKNVPLTLFLAPRHPERFPAVLELLRRKNVPFACFSALQDYKGHEKVILIDAMGQLPACYAASQVAIVGGSFIPNIGGHNVLEPCIYGCPVLFGPYVFAQKELAQKVAQFGAGKEVGIAQVCEGLAEIVKMRDVFSENALLLSRESRGATLKTWQQIVSV